MLKKDEVFTFAFIFHDNVVPGFVGHILKNDLTSEKP